jgi:arylsulfatase A-like enzyme
MTYANRAPLMLAHPAGSHSTVAGYVEFVDIFPSLAELAGISVPQLCASAEYSQVR